MGNLNKSVVAVAAMMGLGIAGPAAEVRAIHASHEANYSMPKLSGPGGGKGRNKHPHVASGVAAAKRAKRKRKNVMRHKMAVRAAMGAGK